MTRLPVVAAVPNYNMGEQLTHLLPRLMEGGYDAIYVLDDNSSDNSREITRTISSDIHFVGGEVNKGAGANRNRILGALSTDALVHFVDADTIPETERMAEVVADAMPAEPIGFLGGLVLNEGSQSIWNFGPRQCLWSDTGALIQDRIGNLMEESPERAQKLRERFSGLLENWPNPFEEPERRRVFWVIESSLVTRSDVLRTIGGFDENLREHEIQDLAIRMAGHGLARYFDPAFSLTQTEVDVRHYNRQKAMAMAEIYIQRKHGLRQWILPKGKLKPAA